METGRIIWIGLGCCMAALILKLFPETAYELGADAAAAWLVFGFGVFLIILSFLFGVRCRHERD